jgi:hypothetical protein
MMTWHQRLTDQNLKMLIFSQLYFDYPDRASRFVRNVHGTTIGRQPTWHFDFAA